jgi:FkbM family methyltransferase
MDDRRSGVDQLTRLVEAERSPLASRRGTKAPVGSQRLVDRLRQPVAALGRRRDSRLVRAAAEVARVFVRAYDSSTRFDIDHNGERRILQQLGPALEIVFDVGANVGDWTQAALDAGAGVVHAFEISPPTVLGLCERFESRDDVIVNRFGLGRSDGEITIRHYPEHPALSTTTEYPHEAEFVEIAAEVRRGDSYVAAMGLRRVDLVKIDVEGAEDAVLAGLDEALSVGRIGAVQFEYGLVHHLTRFFLSDFYDLFTGHGFVLGPILPGAVRFMPYQVHLERSPYANFLAVHEGRTDLLGLLSAGSGRPATAAN